MREAGHGRGTGTADLRPLQVEANGINVIAENERKGHPRDLFWPWFAANISVLGLSYGSFELGFGISFWQALVVGVVGIVLSFLACGFIAVAGKRGSAPTMVLSRAAFGVNGNKLPAVISWLLTVGWETVLVILATLATATVFQRLGWGGGNGTKVVALIVVVALTIFGGVMGFDLIMRMQTWITIVTGVFTVVFIVLVVDKIHWTSVSAIKGGSTQELIGALVFTMTGFGLGWVNCAADYSRYLPRRVLQRWRRLVDHLLVLGGAGVPAGVRAAAGRLVDQPEHGHRGGPDRRADHAAADLVPGAVRHRGRARPDRRLGARHLLLRAGPAHPGRADPPVRGCPDRRHGDDGGHHLRGVLRATTSSGQFEGFLITLGVPIAAWCGIMLADIALRRRDYAEADLFTPSGRYGDVRWIPVLTTVVATGIGWGLVTNSSASWLTWQGYLLGPFGLGGKTGAWAYANLGVLIALAIGFVVTALFSRSAVRAEEAATLPAPAAAQA